MLSFRSDLLIKKIKTSNLHIDMERSNPKFGTDYTDHMLEIDYSDANGWSAPVIRPLEPFQIHPGNSTFHYSLSCFEGACIATHSF